MKNLTDFLKNQRYAVIWTGCYIALTWFILSIFFGFNIFSISDWIILSHAQLRGFAGFVFGIFVLSALPLYVATTTIVVRTKKPLFKIGPDKKKKAEPAPEKKPTPDTEHKPLSESIPTELHGAFLRARQSVGTRPVSAFDIHDTENVPLPKSNIPDAVDTSLPLPDDFGFSAPDDFTTKSDTPMFREISFGTSDNVTQSTAPKTESVLVKYLTENNRTFSIDDEAVIYNGFAIATHSDSDFWVADNDAWFASGKQKESPITLAKNIAKKHGVKPAIYLGEKNIMDIDNQIKKWESDNIRVITDISNL